MTILVTGSDGFIGKALSTKLDFVPLDSKRGTRVEWSKPFLEYLKPEVVIHLASHSTVKQTIKEPSEAVENIITNTVRLVEWAKPKHFIYFSSSMVYGNFEDGVKEYDIPQPTNLYGLYKLAAEEAIRLSGINYTIIYVLCLHFAGNRRQPRGIWIWILSSEYSDICYFTTSVNNIIFFALADRKKEK